MRIRNTMGQPRLQSALVACVALTFPACGGDDGGSTATSLTTTMTVGDDGTTSVDTGGVDGGPTTMTATADSGSGPTTGADDGGDSGGGAECPTPGTMEVAHLVFDETDEDPAKAAGVRKVTGQLVVNRTSHANLNFLACLEEVGDSVQIFGNANLTDLGGLASLRTVTNEVSISENPAMTTIGGMSKLETVGSLVITDHVALQNLNGMSGLGGIAKNLTIRYNDALTSVTGMSSLIQVYGNFNILTNPVLPCDNVAALGDQLTVQPANVDWCKGNLDCNLVDACCPGGMAPC